uniref:Uncharacterized protein n=1 Tax=Aegilops tauschii subsp. strangulata TaxID=200361 RepID=A0A453HI93_AEGTS
LTSFFDCPPHFLVISFVDVLVWIPSLISPDSCNQSFSHDHFEWAYWWISPKDRDLPPKLWSFEFFPDRIEEDGLALLFGKACAGILVVFGSRNLCL